MLAVLVHGLAYDGKVDKLVLQKRVVLVVSVREHEQLKELDKLNLRGRVQLRQQSGER